MAAAEKSSAVFFPNLAEVAQSQTMLCVVYLVSLGMKSAVASMLIAAFTSAFMIGGKAYGKGIAISNSEKIVLFVGRAMAFFEKKRRPKPRKKKAA